MLILYSLLGFLALICVTLACWSLIKQRAWLWVLVISSSVCIAAGLLYWHYGGAKKWLAWQAQTELLQRVGPPSAIIAKLEQHLRSHPESAQGWYLLGRLAVSQGNYTKALLAFAHADALQPNDPKIIYQYAQAEYLAQHRLSSTMEQRLNKIIAQEPHALDVLNLLAINAYQQGLYARAIHMWHLLSLQVPANSPEYASLMEAITKAQSALQAKQHPISIQVRIGLAKQVAVWSKPRTLWVYAVDLKQPMPVAVARRMVEPKDFPLSVSLDNAMAMIPNHDLAHAKQVKVIARISETGQAKPQAGDWQGESKVFFVSQNNNISIAIQQLLSKPL